MPQKFSNNARSRLVGGLSAVATSFAVDLVTADLFPVADTDDWLEPGDWFKLTLQNSLGQVEVVRVGMRTAGSGLMGNVLRGQDGTVPLTFVAGAIAGQRLSAVDVQRCLSGEFDSVEAGTLAVAGNAVVGGTVKASPAVSSDDLVVLAQLDAVRNSLPINAEELTAGEIYSATAGFTLSTDLQPGLFFGVINDSVNPFQVTQGAGLTLRFAGFGLDGHRQAAPRAFFAIFVLRANEYYITGAGLS